MLFVGVLAIALCTAITKQPANFSHRNWAGFLLIGLAAVVCAAIEKSGVAAPLTAGLSLAGLYKLSYDPALPDSIANAMPTSLTLLEPTIPMLLAIIFIVWWVVFSATRSNKIDDAAATAVRAICITAQLILGIGIVLYLGLSHVYDLEGGITFWKVVLIGFLYLDLFWIGIESSARKMFTWPVATVVFLGMVVSFVLNHGRGVAQ